MVRGFSNPLVQFINVAFDNNEFNQFSPHLSGLVSCFVCGSVNIFDSYFKNNILQGTIITTYNADASIMNTAFMYNGIIVLYTSEERVIQFMNSTF